MSFKTKWDKKAANYSRYSSTLNPFMKKVFDFIKLNKISFKDKSVVDIGCGTGVYTIEIAKSAKEVLGIDFSLPMLEVMLEDAKSNDIHNIKTIHSRWDDAKIVKDFDIAFCSMSPAVKDNETFLKMHNCAKEKIYLGWAGKRESSFLNPIFSKFNSFYKAPSGGLELLNWLKSRKISFNFKEINEKRVSIYSLKDAIENASWHLGINNVEVKKDELEKMVKEAVNKKGEIENIVESKMVLICWK
ncbi:MAG: class I SAM-dependent methyltransferase [Sulfurospirillaceae bacterium]|jgi:SAM-dependent methyltransferase|nr:class I SAM-dependent methyltransferase [Sulfurospirillaceae bacterium]MCK9545163.1 class I SAM-dependent methyltransferase [Sulfurospirillaceae bacterium]MDY0238242.1 class I SAM-dependent methyltransferase [Campylobacterales bacterium]